MKKRVFCLTIIIAIIAIPSFGQKKQAQGAYLSGRGYVDQSSYDKAIEAFTRAIELGPAKPEYYTARGKAYEKLSKFNEAKSDYEAALLLDPKNSDAISSLSLVSDKINKSKEKSKKEVVENDLIVENSYSSPLIKVILEAFKNSNSNFNYNDIYSKAENTKSFTNTASTSTLQRISGFVGDKAYVVSDDFGFSLVTEFIKFLRASNQREKEKYFISMFDYIYYGGSPSDLNASSPDYKQESIASELYPGNGNAGKVKYTYVNELGIFFVEIQSPSIFSNSDISTYFYAFDPIYGPLQFVKDPNGFKLFQNQRDPVRLDIIRENNIFQQKDPNQRNSYYELPSRCYIKNPSGSYPDYGYILRVNSGGDTYVDHMQLPRYGYTSISSDQIGFYKIGQDYYIEEGMKEYRYYPTYDEKIQIFQAGGISNADVNNPNYYYLKKESDRRISFYTLINNNGYKLLPFSYTELKSLGDNLFLTKINNKYGLIMATSLKFRSGMFRIFDNVFEEILDNKNGTFKVKMNGNSFVVDIKGNILN